LGTFSAYPRFAQGSPAISFARYFVQAHSGQFSPLQLARFFSWNFTDHFSYWVSTSILRRRQLFLKIHNLFYLNQKPAVNLREVENLVEDEPGTQCMPDEEDAFGVGHAQLAADDVAREDVAVAIA
jgi:hypothetical protein